MLEPETDPTLGVSRHRNRRSAMKKHPVKKVKDIRVKTGMKAGFLIHKR